MDIEVKGTEELVAEVLEERNSQLLLGGNDKTSDRFRDSLVGYIGNEFNRNKEARRDSGIEEELIQNMEAFNGEYDRTTRSALEEDGGSVIFMNVTATKCRACASWIKDILLPSSGRAWRFTNSATPEINPKVMDEIQSILDKEFVQYQAALKSPPPGEGAATGQQEQGVPGQPAQPQNQVGRMAKSLREMNRAKRDIEEAFQSEVNAIARAEMKKLEDTVEAQLERGDWKEALSEFIDDFCVFPAAFMKGPILQNSKKLVYKDGIPVAEDTVIYKNRRVSAFDMYPSANASCVNDGSLIEHLRFHRSEISALKGVKGYSDERIKKVLEQYSGEDFIHYLQTDLESDKANAERRGNEYQANRNIIHGLHFFGKAPVKLLKEWGLENKKLAKYDDTDEVEIEAIVVDHEVIKVALNEDPLCRRPYYKASFQNRPGSFWGRSLPHLMRDIQRMCNGTARALSNNMGMASGPQVEVYVDRLADRGDIEDIKPMKIWQLTSDPTGAGGRAITFDQPTSNAAELLAVYKEFELRADDSTGIPRYAYGNERTGGAAQTASGLSMLLESASKGIKDAIRHIDDGLIKPRIEYQFYWLLKYDRSINYSGELYVVPEGSAALTMKAAEQAKRLELMQALSGNPAILKVVGAEGMAQIFKVLFEDANMPEILIPSGMELRMMAEEEAKAEGQKQQMVLDMEQKKTMVGLEATKIQIDGQRAMHQDTMRLKEAELQLKREDSTIKSRDKARELDSRERQTAQRAVADAERAKAERDFNDLSERRRMAFELTDLQEGIAPTEVMSGRES